ncbi:MAG: hypothetical protein FJY07_12365, partial [Bacteroidetes bacterium]|nr:hypothetical protein [Bacteroidota bacterium]
MKFKVGDKVKFLNERGGGIISKVISPGMVNVAIEDGFDIPVMISEIIKIESEAPADSPRHFFREDYSVKIQPAHHEPKTVEIKHGIPLSKNPGQGTVDEGIYLAFV